MTNLLLNVSNNADLQFECSSYNVHRFLLHSTFSFYCGLIHVPMQTLRAKLDKNEKLADFVSKLEAACIGTVESGKMTKDLAILVHGPK